MSSPLPARDGAAARLASLIRQRGLTADIRQDGPALVLIIGNPAVPFGNMAQRVALVRDDEHGEAFIWLFEGARPGTWDTEPLGPAHEVEAAASRVACVLAVTSPGTEVTEPPEQDEITCASNMAP